MILLCACSMTFAACVVCRFLWVLPRQVLFFSLSPKLLCLAATPSRDCYGMRWCAGLQLALAWAFLLSWAMGCSCTCSMFVRHVCLQSTGPHASSLSKICPAIQALTVKIVLGGLCSRLASLVWSLAWSLACHVPLHPVGIHSNGLRIASCIST